MTDIPKKVLGDKPKTPEEFAAQNKRISDYFIEKAAEEAAKKLEEGGK